MIKKYLEDHLQLAFSSVRHFKANLVGKELLVSPQPLHGWEGRVCWGGTAGWGGQHVRAEQCVLRGNKPKPKRLQPFFFTSSSQSNPNFPWDVFSPSSYQEESFTLSGMD